MAYAKTIFTFFSCTSKTIKRNLFLVLLEYSWRLLNDVGLNVE